MSRSRLAGQRVQAAVKDFMRALEQSGWIEFEVHS